MTVVVVVVLLVNFHILLMQKGCLWSSARETCQSVVVLLGTGLLASVEASEEPLGTGQLSSSSEEASKVVWGMDLVLVAVAQQGMATDWEC